MDWIKHVILFVLLSLSIAGCMRPVYQSPPPVTAVAGVRVRLDSFVSAGYQQGRSLPGLNTTAKAIETTLAEWYEQAAVGQQVLDAAPGELVRFLDRLPGPEDCAISVVYIGSIQTPDRALMFANGAFADWREILRQSTPPAHPGRIVILDVCHGGAVRDIHNWHERLAPVTLLASGRTERTYQFEPVRLAPIDVQKHYPLAGGWAQMRLGPGWDRHISFLGLMWMATTVQTAAPPSDMAGWKVFLDNCSRTAADFRQSKGRRWGSTLQTF